MKKSEPAPKKDPFVRWMLLGIPVLFIVASPLHFLYEWSGKSLAVGLFTPINESPWEHLKLTFWPILVWWGIGYLLLGRKSKDFRRAAVSCAVCAVTCLLFIVAFFYTYTGAFGIDSLILDIISLLLGLTIGILLAVHVCKYSSPGAFGAFISVLVLLLMAAAFLYFTFSPPHISLFKDPPSGTYGIRHSAG